MAGALAWSEEINKHNQRLFKQEQAKNQGKHKGGNAANDSDGNKPPFKLVPVRDLIASPRKFSWAIKGIYELGSTNLLSGAYATYKSFLEYDKAFCVAAGIDWHGHKVIQLAVVILAGEGHSGIADRFEALAVHYGVEVPACLYVSEVAAGLTDCDNAQWVGDAVNAICPEAGLVVLDTLARNYGSGDESSSKDMGAFVQNVDSVFRNTGKTVVIVHHSGWGAERGRGSSLLPSACEGEYFIKRQGDCLTVTCTKQKNAPEHEPMTFRTKVIELGRFDDEGEAVSSLVLEMTNDAGGKTTDKSKLTPREVVILTSLKDVLARDDSNDFATLESWRDEVMQVIDGESDAKRMAFNRCKEKLLKLDFIVERDGLIWLCEQ
jgi:hypothetical protein